MNEKCSRDGQWALTYIPYGVRFVYLFNVSTGSTDEFLSRRLVIAIKAGFCIALGSGDVAQFALTKLEPHSLPSV